MPCQEWFARQDLAYREQVLPSQAAKVSIEAAEPTGWKEFLGPNSDALGIDHFGASAAGSVLYREFGITAEALADKARALLGRRP